MVFHEKYFLWTVIESKKFSKNKNSHWVKEI